jgi:hypothetical protein
MGLLRLDQGNLEEVLKFFQKATEIDPSARAFTFVGSVEVELAKQVTQFTQFTFVGLPTMNEPGTDGILTGSGGLTHVRGVASLRRRTAVIREF